MRICFTYPRTIYGKLVCWFTWSRFSHVFLEDGSYIYESYPGIGVRKLQRSDMPHEKFEAVQVPYNRKVVAQIASQVGSGYDYSGVLGFFFRRDWHREDRWFCSEIIAWAYERAGESLIKRRANRVTPQDLYEAIWRIKKE